VATDSLGFYGTQYYEEEEEPFSLDLDLPFGLLAAPLHLATSCCCSPPPIEIEAKWTTWLPTSYACCFLSFHNIVVYPSSTF
jgi:hypothetical protein